jgi:predicted small lipoprotein YifL
LGLLQILGFRHNVAFNIELTLCGGLYMNTRLSSCRTVCLPLMVAVALSACGYKGSLYMPPTVSEPAHAVPSDAQKSNLTVTPAVSNATSTQIPMKKKVVNQ